MFVSLENGLILPRKIWLNNHSINFNNNNNNIDFNLNTNKPGKIFDFNLINKSSKAFEFLLLFFYFVSLNFCFISLVL